MKQRINNWMQERLSSVSTRKKIAAIRKTSRQAKAFLPRPSTLWNLGDQTLWVIYIMLIITSILVVYSSTAKMAYNSGAISSTMQFLHNQLILVAVSSGMLFIAFHVNLSREIAKRYLPPTMFWLSIAFVILAYLFGNSINGAARWLRIGFFQFQPSEMLKLATVLMVARGIDRYKSVIGQMRILPYINPKKWHEEGQMSIIKNGFYRILAPVIVAAAIVVPGHTSSALIIVFVSLLLMIIGRIKLYEICRIVCVGGAIFLLYLFSGLGRSGTANNRLETWFDIMAGNRTEIPVEDLSDTERSMIAIHNGGFMGLGPGQSAMRVEMIHPESDYAFAFVVEEYGLLGAIFVLFAYLWIFYRTMRIFQRSSSPFAALCAVGLMLMITAQAFLHIAVALNFLPETGQTLPLISRGGSSLLFNAIAFGLIMSVARQIKLEENLNAAKLA